MNPYQASDGGLRDGNAGIGGFLLEIKDGAVGVVLVLDKLHLAVALLTTLLVLYHYPREIWQIFTYRDSWILDSGHQTKI